MIAKTFQGGRTVGGAKATIAYLLNERVSQGTSKMIRGDTAITQKLIGIASKKQAWSWSSGVLSFEELIKDDAVLDDIMDDFERTFFAGLEKDNYNISWILHTDKGRTELHYIAPRLELSTGLSFNPYFVKRDFSKKDLFQDYINLKHGLSMHQYSERPLVRKAPAWAKNAKKAYIRKAIDDALLLAIENNGIDNREDIIYQLQEWGCELKRVGKRYISVVDKHGNTHRLKGEIYSEDFTSLLNINGVITKEVPLKKIKQIEMELDSIVSRQGKKNRERYAKKKEVQEIETVAEKQKTNKGEVHDTVGTEAIRRIGSIRERKAKRTRELDRVFKDAYTAKRRDYTAIEQRAKRKQLERGITRTVSSINRSVPQIKQAFDYRTKAITRTVIASKEKKEMNELNKFKREINLAEFVTSFGYHVDKEKSSINAPVMRHENGDKIIVGKSKSDSHYIYFNPNDDSDNGTIIDFIQKRLGENLGHLRKRLRAWLHNPQPQEKINIKASTKDALGIATKWDNLQGEYPIFKGFQGIRTSVVSDLIRNKKAKMIGDNMYFMLNDVNGICGIEKRTSEGKKYIEKGSKKGVFTDGKLREGKRIIFFESPIDMLAYKELGHGEKGDYCCCTMGSLGDTAKEAIAFILENNQTAEVVYAVDNDQAGMGIAEQIKELDKVEGRTHQYDLPDAKDWKDELIIQDNLNGYEHDDLIAP